MRKSTLKIDRYSPLVMQGFSNFLGLFQVIMANPPSVALHVASCLLPFHTLLTSSNFSHSPAPQDMGFSPSTFPVRSMDFTTNVARALNSTNLALVLVSASQLKNATWKDGRMVSGQKFQFPFFLTSFCWVDVTNEVCGSFFVLNISCLLAYCKII